MSHRPVVLTLVAALLVALCSCESSGPRAESELAEPAKAPGPKPSEGPERVPRADFEERPADHMKDHFGVVEQARDALILADLQAAEGPLTWLSQHRFHGEVPEAWEPHVSAMQSHARSALGSSQVGEVASQLVAVAAACGDCHRALGRVPTLPPTGFEDLDDAASESVRRRMHRHLWAVDRMWEALVLPDPSRFALAGQVLADSKALKADSPAVQAGVARVKTLGTRALAAKTPDAQRAVLAEFLATCAGCHGGVGLGAATGTPQTP